MQDSHGRTIDYIRISVTDQCNLRCVYCMPCENTGLSACQLTIAELETLCGCFAELGIQNIKITGGEPLMRRDVAEIIFRIKKIPGIRSVTLTTNGVLLAEKIKKLREAGLDAVNISMDSLSETEYEEISQRNMLGKTLEGLEAALACPGLSVKINCVPIKGMNDSQIVPIAALAKDRNLHVRFIEMMPIGYGKNFAFQGEEEIKRRLEKELGIHLVPYEGRLGHGPSHYYTAKGFQGKIGFISAVTHKFCDDCNRVRLTSDGFLKTCLQYNIGCDLKALLEKKAPREQLLTAIRESIYNKPLCHHFEQPEKDRQTEEQRGMSQIGG